MIGILIFVICDCNKVYKECFAEAGVNITPQDFFKNNNVEANFIEKSDVPDTRFPGKYNIVLQAGGFSYRSTLYIKDSIAPTGEAVKVRIELGDKCEPSSFVENIVDATSVTITYKKEPDFSQTGIQQVEVVLTDLGGNESIIKSELYISKVVYEITVEAGSKPPELLDFVLEAKEAELISPIQDYDYTEPSDKIVYLKVDGEVYYVVMHIVDTIPPKVKVKNLSGYLLVKRKAEDFIVSVQDVTNVSFTFMQEPDVRHEGTQNVMIKVTDEGGNKVIKSAQLTLKADTEAPTIEGVTDLKAFRGSSILYKKDIHVSDNCMEGLQLTVDNHAVNVDEVGIYPVTYTAKDLAGNITRVSAHVIIEETDYTEAEIYVLADSVLNEIITMKMSQMEKARAIYDYIKSHISYAKSSVKGNWMNAAYEGLVNCKGDCYTYASTAKALLTRAGITNMDIAKKPTKTSHYWNLVNVGDGWYHFDSTPRHDHPEIFMWTEEQLMEYSAKHKGTHNYDHELYPVVN